MIYILLMMSVVAKQKVYSFQSSDENIDYWLTNRGTLQNFSLCNDQTIFGGYQVFDTNKEIMRNFQLAPHSRIYIQLTFYRIDAWNSDQFNIYLDHTLVYNQILSNGGGENLCGNTAFDDQIIEIQLESQHSSNFAIISLQAIDIQVNQLKGFWGISDLSLSIEECPNGCEYCESNLDCKLWALQYWDQNFNLYSYYIHPLYARFLNQTLVVYNLFLPSHYKVMIRFKLYVWISKSLIYQILINNQVKVNGNQNGHSVYYTFFDVKIPAFFHTDTYINIKLQHTGGTQNTIPIRDFQLFILRDEQIYYILGCLNQINLSCLECESGWNLDQTQQCISFCGDQIIRGNEQCDDGNSVPFDGCYNCQLECNQFCLECKLGICQQCSIGYELNLQNKCVPICQDGLIVSQQKGCDDSIMVYGFQKLQCEENCLQCKFGFCQECLIGFQLIRDKCVPICGDQIIIQEYEECDDGNIIPFDGCLYCQYSCPLFCLKCHQGICYQCQVNYFLENQVCYPHNYCGNKIIEDQEECDDGNDVAYDGCFQCILEMEEVQSENFKYEYPQLIIKYLNQTFSIQYVEISFSQDVTIESNLQVFDLFVKNNENSNITIANINAKYVVSIIIHELLLERPILSVNFLGNAYNQFNQSIQEKNYEIQLLPSKYLNEDQMQMARLFYKVNQNIVYCLAAFSLISLIFGESSIFSEILNILQYLSYLKYINLAYPENLYIFFQFTDMISITPFVQFLNLDIYGGYIIQEGKLAEYEVQADLIINLICQLLQFIGLLVSFCAFLMIRKSYYSKMIISKYFLCQNYLSEKINPNIMLQVSKLLFNVVNNSKLQNLQKIFELKQILLMNSWDLIFKILLCYKGIRDQIQVLLSTIIAGFYLQIQYQLIELINLIRVMLFLFFIIFLQSNQVLQTILISQTNLIYIIVVYWDCKQNKKRPNYIELQVQGTIVLFTFLSICYFDDFAEYFNYNFKIQLGFAQMGILTSSIFAYTINFLFENCKSIINWVKQRKLGEEEKRQQNLFE